MKILLCSPPVYEIKRPKGKLVNWASSPPLGLIYLSQSLKASQITSKCIDFFNYSWEEIELFISKTKPDIIGIPCFTERRKASKKIALIAKKINPKTIIIMGGTHATLFPEQTLNHFNADYIVRNEGELSFTELIKNIINNGKNSLKDIKGISFKNNGRVINNEGRKLIENLDELPLIDYNAFDFNAYQTNYFDERSKLFSNKTETIKKAVLITSRGCTFNCQYCSTTKFWQNKIRFRSIQNIIDEIEMLYYKFNVRFFSFTDDAFNLNNKRILELCEKIKSKKLKIAWNCVCRVTNPDLNVFKAMKEAGCFMITFGVESGSLKILKTINKKIKIEDIHNSFLFSKKAGLFREMLLMVGNPGENNKTISETIEAVNAVNPDDISVNLTSIFPGTALYEIAKEKNFINDDYWLTDYASPYYTIEHSYPYLIYQANRIMRAFYKIKFSSKKTNKILLREMRDFITYFTGIKLGKKGIKFIKPFTELKDNWF